MKSVQRSKSETESRKSTDNDDFEISPNQFPISNNAHTEAEAEGYHRSGDRGSSRAQSLQRSKCYTESPYSTDETDVEISLDLVEDLNDARPENKDEGRETKDGRASRPSTSGWSSWASSIGQETERRDRSFDSEGSEKFSIRRVPKVITNGFEDNVWTPYRI